MKRLGMGIVGPGFIAPQHVEAVRRLGDVEVIALAGSTQASATRKARELGIERAYGAFQDLVGDPQVDVVHNTTPNYLHFEVTMAALRAGKHVISDKPLAVNPTESRELLQAALAAQVAHVVTFNYRGAAMIQEMRERIAAGEIGEPFYIHGRYLQDWLTDPQVYSWRLDPAKGGPSSALGDIGSHWCDLAEHVAGSRIRAVLADLTTVVNTRYSAGASAEAFASVTGAERTPVEITSEDLGSVLLRFENGAKGMLAVGQVLPGHKNDLQLEVNGRRASLQWRQERQNELWVGRDTEPNEVLTKQPAALGAAAKLYARLPAGHQEGWADGFRNIMADAYQWIRDGADMARKPAATASFVDGYRNSCVIEAMLVSHAAGGTWVEPQA
jgi:predicted dehydrogenase